MDTKVVWKHDLSFTGSADSGFEMPLGTEREVGGAEDGFRPIELMALSLAGCTGMDVISIMRKKQQQVTAFEVQAHADRESDYPKAFTRVVLTYIITGRNVDETALRRSIELSVTKYCPAYAMLSKVIPIESVYEIYEDKGEQAKELVKRGVFQPQPLENR